MRLLPCIIEGDAYGDQFFHYEVAADRFWRHNSNNDWFANLARKGERLHLDEPPGEHDTVEVMHRYYQGVLEALKPWLEYRFTQKEY